MTSRLFRSGWTFGAALLLPLLAAGPALADFGSCVAGWPSARSRPASTAPSPPARSTGCPAGREGAALSGGAAGVQDADLGLSRLPGRRAARRRRPRHDAPIRPRAAAGGAALRRRPPRHRRGLGRRERLRAGARATTSCRTRSPRSSARRAAHGFLARRADRGAEAGRARRPAAGRALRLLGRRLRADAVHPLDLSAPGGRFRRRRPARPGQFGRRRARLDRQLPEALRLAGRRALDDRGQGAGRL